MRQRVYSSGRDSASWLERVRGAALSVMVVVAVGSWTSELRADCQGPHSSCLSADSLWVDPFPGAFFGLTAPTRFEESWALGASLAYQERPIVAVLASPDPFGNEVAVLDGFWTLQSTVATSRLAPLDVGLVVPASIGSGSGAEALANRSAESSIGGFGDPRIVVRWSRRSEGMQLSVLHTLTLPVGQASSYLGSRGVVYAPKVAWSYSGSRAWLTLEVGARLRRASRLGSMRFGSEASMAAGAGAVLTRNWQLLGEWWATPALASDEIRYPAARVTTRRAPSELLVSLRTRVLGADLQAGVGTSIPLSVEQRPDEERASFAGPPGPAIRLQLQLGTEW